MTRTLREDWKAGETARYRFGGTPSRLPNDTVANAYKRNGQAIAILRAYTEPDEHHDAECLPMFLVRFPDGYEVELWADELEAPACGYCRDSRYFGPSGESCPLCGLAWGEESPEA